MATKLNDNNNIFSPNQLAANVMWYWRLKIPTGFKSRSTHYKRYTTEKFLKSNCLRSQSIFNQIWKTVESVLNDTVLSGNPVFSGRSAKSQKISPLSLQFLPLLSGHLNKGS